MRRGWLAVALLLSLGANLGLVGAAFARRRAIDRWEERAHARLEANEHPLARPGGRLARELGLDREHERGFVEAHRRMAEDVVAARREIADVRAELRREVGAPSSDRARLDALLGELARAESALNRAVVDGVLAAKAELDSRQRRRYLELLERLGPPGRGFERRGSREGAPLPRRFGGDEPEGDGAPPP